MSVIYTDDFTGANGSTPDPTKWNLLGNVITIQDNKMRIFVNTDDNYRYARFIEGNNYPRANEQFDMQVDFQCVTYPESDTRFEMVMYFEGANNYVRMGWFATGGVGKYYDMRPYVGGDQKSVDNIITTDLSGKFRMTRPPNSGLITCYYDDSGWQEIGTWSDPAFSTACSNPSLFGLTGNVHPDAEVRYDNFRLEFWPPVAIGSFSMGGAVIGG